jgi:glutaminyl-peptide cyclotransferase
MPALTLLVMAYIQSRPNATDLALSGPFDGERAFADLKTLVSFGPRPSGSQALDRTREFTIAELRAAGAGVAEDKFVAKTPIGSIPMANIIAKIPGASPSIVIIGGHYDTKRMATPFVGANDGGSSAAFLLEMARVLAQRRNQLTYWVVFFDGEEAVQRWSVTDSLYGSRHLAAEVAASGAQRRVKAMILVDMIADAALDVHRDTNSTRWLQGLVFSQARRLGYGRYFSGGSKTVEDDHIPFVQIGIPAVDIIDLDFGPLNLYWHTRYDTVARCSSASLKTVGHVLLATLAAVEASSVGTGIKGSQNRQPPGSQDLRSPRQGSSKTYIADSADS